MLRATYCLAACLAAALFLIAPLIAVAATAPRPGPSDSRATIDQRGIDQVIKDPSAQRCAQNDALRSSPSAARRSPQAQGPAQVYLLRGFLNVFSLGMDDLAAKLQADGISATVMNHADADYVASRILTTYNAGDHGPIMLIGHSLGADAVVDLANALARYNIPVVLLVLFDGTESHQIPANVATAINYTKHFMIAPAPGSRGVVSNVDLSADASIDHLNIDTIPSLQTQTLNYIFQAASPLQREPVSRRQ
jgi:hypothetical protein